MATLESLSLTRKTWLALSLRAESSGLSTGVWRVNLESNWLTSSSDCFIKKKKQLENGEQTVLLLLLSRFSRVRLCVTPQMAAHKAFPVPGILQARTLEWVAISFSNVRKVKSEGEVAQSCLTPSDPWTAAYQAPPSMDFPGKEYWSGVPLPSPRLYYT